MSEMFFGLLIHSSGDVRVLNILFVSGSMSECFVSFNILLRSRFKPFVLGVRVSLNTIGAGLLFRCVSLVLWFCFMDALRSSSGLLVGVKYCCMHVIVCALLHS